MTALEYWRILAIQAAAAGPYRVVGRCHFCGTEEALASFQPAAFSARVASCRRCREAKTGVPDERGLIHGTATISRPLEEPTPVRIRGLIPATCPDSRPVVDVDAIFAPWGSNAGELPQIPGDSDSIDAELLALTDLDAQLDAMIADLDRRRDDALLGIVSSSEATSSETRVLTTEALIDLKAKYGRRLLRIIADCPMFPTDSAFEWERRGVMFLGSEVLAALAREAERIDGFSHALGRPLKIEERRFLGLEVEPWGSKDDHTELAMDLIRELNPS